MNENYKVNSINQQTLNIETVRNDFNNLNLDNIDPNLPPATLGLIFKHYISSVVLYGFILILIYFNPWYNELLNASFNGLSVQRFFLNYYILYITFSPLVLLIYKPKSLWESKNILVVQYLLRVIKYLSKPINTDKSELLPTYKEKQSIMFFLIKMFFAPQMIQFTFAGLSTIAPVYNDTICSYSNLFKNNPVNNITWAIIFNNLYFLLIKILFIIDTGCFAVGYLTEASFLRNKIRFVETSLFGILVCIICYTPFNRATTTFLSWTPDDGASFFGDPNSLLTLSIRVIAIFFVVIYSMASVALFTRASNLTNRGIVSSWPYNMVRHPAYMAKNTFWWLTTIPFFFVTDFLSLSNISRCLFMIFSMLSWSFIYYLRAVTEERLLSKDPDYLVYKQKVKYRFIPYFW